MASVSATVCRLRHGIYVLIFVLTVGKCIATNTKTLYKRTNDTYLQNSFTSVTASTDVRCCVNCELLSTCKSVSYKQSTEECLLSEELLATVSMNGQTDTEWNTYSKDEWMLVFRATPGIGGDVYTAWIDAESVTTNDVTCMTTDVTSCGQNYRNPIVDSWTSVGISEVKFAFFKDNNEVAFVIFDGTGSKLTTWFHKSRIKASSWTNIATDEFSFFSIFGMAPSRRFLTHHIYDGGDCPTDSGYSAVIVSEFHECLYDQHTSYPQFLYASSATFGTFESMSDGGWWSSWAQWSICTVTCREGIQTRSRTCTNPLPSSHGKYCEGDPMKVVLCNKDICNADIVFKAKVVKDTSPTRGQTMIFGITLVNEGNFYSTSTGIFTAPVKGTYSFSTQFYVIADKELAVAIMVDGVIYAAVPIYDNQVKSCDTEDTVAVLHAQSKVWVECINAALENIIYDDSYRMNSFSGYLVHQ